MQDGGFHRIDTQHVRYGDDLVPEGETEFAKDKTFGYAKSYLCEYVKEKTGGGQKSRDIITSVRKICGGKF